nr:ISL3 family transposase [Streptosporangium canum]
MRAPSCRARTAATRRVVSTAGIDATLTISPWVGGRSVVIDLSVRRLFCDARDCARRTFTEQIEGLSTRYGRRTPRLQDLLRVIALALAGRAGTRLATMLHTTVSRVTLLNLIMALPEPAVTAPRILGVDDFATKRGRVYGTVLIDGESHRPIDLLPDREADTLATWLANHPGGEVICRDRASTYADGARARAPDAIQVADRWHLWNNLATAVERTVIAHRPCLHETDPQASARAAAAAPAELNPDTGGEKWVVTRTRERYLAVQRLLARGWTISAIGRELGLARHTAGRYARCENLHGLTDRTIRTTRLDDYKPYLIQRWNDGCTDAARLFREIRARGYPGRTPQAVRRYLRPLRTVAGPVPAPPPVPKPHRVAHWIMRHPDRLHADEESRLKDIMARCPQLNAVHRHVRAFAQMLCNLQGENLTVWIDAVRADDLPVLHSFAANLHNDRDAITAGLTQVWSSGPTEGQVNRIKMLKRQMYGRAGFALLRKRVLLT